MASLSHASARRILHDAWVLVHGREPSSNELAYVQAIAYLETGYGRSGQFGLLADQGMYNWGAQERKRNADGSCPAGTAAGSDQGPVCFYIFANDTKAAAAFVKNLTTRHWPVIQAMRGTAEDVARAMRVPPAYYAGFSGSEEDRVSAYAKAIRNALTAAKSKLAAGATSEGPSVLAVAGLVLLGYGAWELWKSRRR